MKFVLIGAGQRGMVYAREIFARGHEIAAVAEQDRGRREAAAAAFGIPAELCFASSEPLWTLPKLGEAAIIATLDRDHYRQAVPAMEKGYHLLLEKPISPVPEEALAVEAAARRLDRHVAVCHVLRYSPFFRAVKQVLDSGAIGRVITVQHNENIGNYHIAHSFVRGNWRNESETSTLMMQKSCHDMDLLVWLLDSGCRRVSSFGDRTYFRAENAPDGATERCVDCPLRDTCRFSAYLAYLPVMGQWPATVLTADQTEAGLREAIRTGPYGRCVFHCDNTVCDHQVTAMEFCNGVTVTFNLSGFTNRMMRTLKIMGENGEIRASEGDNVIEITKFAPNGIAETESTVIHPRQTFSGHGGGDSGIVEDFLALLEGRTAGVSSDITRSVESHLMACAADESRRTGKTVEIAAFRQQHQKG